MTGGEIVAAIPGCSVTPLVRHTDARGEFVKVFQRSANPDAGDRDQIAELFWSRSSRGVIRGLHFQIPPFAHRKLVTIVSGTAVDVVLDLRVGSPTYRKLQVVAFDAAAPLALSVPIGCAHGFQATSDDVTILYATTTEHAPGADRGVRWDTIGFAWPIAAAITSPRDSSLAALDDYQSPFLFEGRP